MNSPTRQGPIARRLAKYARYNASEKGRARHERYEQTVKGRICKILKNMRYRNKLADARDAAQLAGLLVRARSVSR